MTKKRIEAVVTKIYGSKKGRDYQISVEWSSGVNPYNDCGQTILIKKNDTNQYHIGDRVSILDDTPWQDQDIIRL